MSTSRAAWKTAAAVDDRGSSTKAWGRGDVGPDWERLKCVCIYIYMHCIYIYICIRIYRGVKTCRYHFQVYLEGI